MHAKISKYMDIKRIEFIVTWQCGGKCKHCQVGDDINQRGPHRHVLSDYAVEAVKKLAAAYDVTSVMTFGGEPLHYPAVTAAIHKAAADCGIKTRQIITNGYFTNSAKESGIVADLLAGAGVNNLLLSVDAFHQEHIPLEPVYQFARDIIRAKIPGAFLYPAWLIHEEHQNPYNAETRKILEKFSDLAIAVKRCDQHVELGNGHAAKFLREYADETERGLPENRVAAPCSEPLNVTNISIVPSGDVMICGFVIGNIYREDIMDVATRYDPYRHDGMRAVTEGGVTALLAYAGRQGIDPSEYCSACDLCHAAAKRLTL